MSKNDFIRYMRDAGVNNQLIEAFKREFMTIKYHKLILKKLSKEPK